MAESEIKGLILKSRYDFILNRYGKEGLEKLIGHLHGNARSLMSDPKNIRSVTWYPLSVQAEIDDAIFEHLAGRNDDIFFEMGTYSAEFWEEHGVVKNIAQIRRFLLRHGDMFPRFFRPGHMEVVIENDGEVYFISYGFRSTKRNCLTNLGFFTKRIERAGVHVTEWMETQCTEDPDVDKCVYRIRWK